MKYDDIDFLEFFDSEKIIDQETGMIEYVLTSGGISLNVIMNIYDDNVYFSLSTETLTELIDFYMRDVEMIICDRGNNQVRFLFYKQGQYVPLVCLYIKPSLSIRLDTEYEESVYVYPYRFQNV